tara:strand:- start:3286 stop:4272 length:987 start_codon:yes stop_codon:yes gene_type:complete
MKRELNNVIRTGLFLLLFWSGTTPSAFGLAEVKASATIEGSTITLGDLFDNLDSGHDIWVSNAPAPGERTTISTRYLASLTRQHNVYWQNSRAVEHIAITRAGRSIKYAALKDLIAGEMESRGLANRKSGIRFDNQNTTLHLPENRTIEDITVQDFTFDKKHNKFSAELSYPTGRDQYESAMIHGSTYVASFVPVLNKIMSPGDQISDRDISWVSMPTLRIGRNIIRDKNNLIGMTPRRGLSAQTPLKLSDLNRPQIIRRGEAVSILFRSGKISLTATGKAIKAGGRGDVIPVMNLKSHKTVEAMITGPNQVEVITAQTDLAHLNTRR